MTALFEDDIVEEYDVGFKNEAIYIQLGRIIDSQSAKEIYNPKGKVKEYFRKFIPVDSVVTDDGVTFSVTSSEAEKIRTALMSLPTPRRAEIFKEIQLSEGFSQVMKVMEMI